MKRKGDELEEAEDGSPKKKKPATKVTKGRPKGGPVDYDKQCGVINDKGLPCSRALACKSHSMGAKRAVLGRSKPYDELLLEWNRAYKVGFVEPVKRETKKEKKEKRDKEREEQKKLNGDKKVGSGTGGTGGGAKRNAKKSGSNTAANGVNGGANGTGGADEDEEEGSVDSEAELDAMVRAIRKARDEGRIGVPLAVPDDAGMYFVARRERLRCGREMLFNALVGRGGMGGVVNTGR